MTPRRLLLTLAVAAVAAVCTLATVATPDAGAQGPIASGTINPNGRGHHVGNSFLGISMEYRALALFSGHGPPVNPVLVRLLRNLGAYGNGPAPLRIGGNSTDESWWNPNHTGNPPPGVTYDLDYDWLTALSRTERNAHPPVTLGLNLGINDPGNAFAFARAAQSRLPRNSIAGFELGNEPDIFDNHRYGANRYGVPRYARPRTYTFQRFLQEFDRYALYAGHALPAGGPLLSGPVFATRTWSLPRFIQRESHYLATVDLHRYPLTVCKRGVPGGKKSLTDPTYPTIPELLSESSSRGLADALAAWMSESHDHGLPLRVSETNSASCGGAVGVSDTFASALWGADAAFEYLRDGARGVFFHTSERSIYTPFELDRDAGPLQAHVRPLYYGMLLFAQATANDAQLVPVQSTGTAHVKLWATRDRTGTIRVVALNKDLSTGGTVQITLPGSTRAGLLTRLQAPSLSSTTGITLAGQTFGDGASNGLLHGTPVVAGVGPQGGGVYQFDVPVASAAMLAIPPATQPARSSRRR